MLVSGARMALGTLGEQFPGSDRVRNQTLGD